MNSRPKTTIMCVAGELRTIVRLSVLSLLFVQSSASWGSSSNGDTTIYGNALSRDWLYDGSKISLKLQGCMWGVTEDNEDLGCIEDSSEDGTTYWYQMANCRRAQAVYDLYSGSGCGSGFLESFVTLNGVSEFVYYLQNYDGMSYSGGGDDDYGDDDDDGGYYNGNGDYDDLPTCEESNGSYIGIGCADDGTFALVYFSDQYCLQPTGNTYDKLRSLNRSLRTYKSCSNIYSNGGNDDGSSLPSMLVASSESCSSLDSGLCTDTSAMKNRRSQTSTSHFSGVRSIGSKTWVTKLKYVVAGLLLVASFVMFTGILFTNRRRRRALMQRKYKQSKRRKSKSRSSRSKSKSRDDRSSREKSSRRSSKSKHRQHREGREKDDGGVFT